MIDAITLVLATLGGLVLLLLTSIGAFALWACHHADQCYRAEE